MQSIIFLPKNTQENSERKIIFLRYHTGEQCAEHNRSQKITGEQYAEQNISQKGTQESSLQSKIALRKTHKKKACRA